MKQRRLPKDNLLKRRYNLCHRLRERGVLVDVDTQAINVTPDEYEGLGKTAKKYCRALISEYHYVLQTYIPCPPVASGSTVVEPINAGRPTAIKFRRRKPPPGANKDPESLTDPPKTD